MGFSIEPIPRILRSEMTTPFESALPAVLDRIERLASERLDGFPHWADPRTGRWTTTPDGDWTGGAWPGQLWPAAGPGHRRELLPDARTWSARLAPRVARRTAFKGFGFYYGAAVGTVLHRDREAAATRGGAHLHGLPGVFVTGIREQGPEGARRDVLVYTSDPLRRDLEVTGNVTVSLWAITSARDTDWTAKLVDVLPDGRSFNVCDGILRARFRDSFEAPLPVTPGDPHHVEIDLGPTSMVFRRGHRIRLHVSSSEFPAHARNLNTGGVNAAEAEPVVGSQTVLHDPEYLSHLRLPAKWR